MKTLVSVSKFFSLAILALSPLRAAPVFSDNFESGDVDATNNTADGDGVSGTDGYDTSFSSGAPINGPYFIAVNDDLLGNAGQLRDGVGNNQTYSFVAAEFTPQTLANTGDKLTLSFDFSIDNLDSNGSAFRFGLWNATSGIDASGPNYWAKASTQTTASITALFKDDETDITTSGEYFPGRVFGTLANSATIGAVVTNNAVRSAEFSLTKTSSGVELSITFWDAAGGGGNEITSLQFEDTASPFTTFNAIGFRQGNVTMDVNIDNIVVDFTPAPVAGGGLAITGVSRSGNLFTINFTGPPASAGSFQVAASDDLTTPFSTAGVVIDTAVAEGAAGEYSVVVDTTADGDSHFYRIEQP